MIEFAKVGNEFIVNTQTTYYQMNSEITGLPNGGFVIAWQNFGGKFTSNDPLSIDGVYAQAYDANGASVGGELAVGTSANISQSYPGITALADSSFVVTWWEMDQLSDNSNVSNVKAQIYSADGIRQGSEIAVAIAGDGPVNPKVTELANGNFVVTWTYFAMQPDATFVIDIRAQLFAADGTRQGGEFVVSSNTTDDKGEVDVTGLVNGGFVVTWHDFDASGALGDGSAYSVHAQVCDASGAKVGSAFLVNTATTGYQYEAEVTGLANGGFVITWRDESHTGGNSSGATIKAQMFDAGGTKQGGEFLVVSQTAGYQIHPAIAALGSGGFVVAWSGSTGLPGDTTEANIKAQVFDATGHKAGREFLINTVTAGEQFTPTVTGLAGGGFAVSWSDDSGTLGDTSMTSIKAQVFAINVLPDPIIGTPDADTLTGTAGSEQITGLAGDDYLNGLGGNDLLRGGEGNDRLEGGAGDDRMEGGAGDDSYVIDSTGDRAFERAGSGTDTVETTFTRFVLAGNLENLIFTDDAAHSGYGNGLDNHIFGGSGNDVLDGKAGADVLVGGSGHDLYYVDNVGDVIIEYPDDGIDSVSSTVSFVLPDEVERLTLRCGVAALDLTGNASNNELIGNSNANVILGLGGDDALSGGKGNDTLTGGSGSDTFLFLTRPSTRSNMDTVTDFVSGIDMLFFEKTVYTGFAADGAIGEQAFHSGAGVNTAHDADDRFIYNTATGALWYDADGTGAARAVEVAVLAGAPALAFSDILIGA